MGEAVLAEARELAQLLGEIASRDGHAEDDLMAALVLAWIGIASALVQITLLGQRYVRRTLGGLLRTMAAEMTRLAAGEQGVTITGTTRRNEIGAMARALAVFHRAILRP